MSNSAVPDQLDGDDDVVVIEGLGQRATFTRRAVKHMVVGAILGFFLSLTLSSILYEIARETPFAVLDILVLSAASIGLFLKQFRASQNKPQSPGGTSSSSPSLSFEDPESSMLTVVRVAAACVGCAALFVILIVATSLPPALKFFFVMDVSASHCFLLCLGCVEVFNTWLNNNSPLIARQLYTVVICSLAVGCLSGFLFGAADVENKMERLGWEEWVAAALCILVGAAVGHANAVASDDQYEIAFDPLPMEESAAGGGGADGDEEGDSTSAF